MKTLKKKVSKNNCTCPTDGKFLKMLPFAQK